MGIYFLFAEIYIWRKTGVNMWKVWWRTNTDSIKTERRFAEEVKQFQKLNLLYRVIKWTTPAIMIACLVLAYFAVLRRT
ncbi:MAG: hypothetical protein JXB04_04075 [Kiritimatiellae bacterium]|nr:hypothetical protein [Kiritimatiellia bacterium]